MGFKTSLFFAVAAATFAITGARLVAAQASAMRKGVRRSADGALIVDAKRDRQTGVYRVKG